MRGPRTGLMAPDRDESQNVIGRSVPRLEDDVLVRGRGVFAADGYFPQAPHLRVLRSLVAHGRIINVDPTAALASPGVAAVWTDKDVAELAPIDFRDDRVEQLVPYRQPVLARGMVRYVGEPVAAVFAADA